MPFFHLNAGSSIVPWTHASSEYKKTDTDVELGNKMNFRIILALIALAQATPFNFYHGEDANDSPSVEYGDSPSASSD